MPKGIGVLAAVLVVVVAAVGGWIWYDTMGGSSGRSSSSSVTAALEPQSPDAGTEAVPPVVTPAPGGIPGSGFGGAEPEDVYEDGELLVLDPPDGFNDAVRSLGFTVLEAVELTSLSTSVYRLQIPSGSTVAEARQQLSAQYPGLAIDANHQFELQAEGNFQNKVPRALIGWSPSAATCGEGVRIGMIDASVDTSHPALVGQDVEFRSFHSEERRPGPADHGTAVAAILVGQPDWGGLLPGATLKAANMFEKNETGRVVGNAMAMLKSINWLGGERVHVVNMSVAGSDNRAVRIVFDKARRKRMIVIAAAGNWGRADKPAYPAAYKDVVAVTAVTEDKSVYENANRGDYIDFAAPGVSVYTAVPSGGRLQSGTSFAAPYISVLMGLAIVGGEQRRPDNLRQVIQQGIVDLGNPGKDDTFGWGLIGTQPGC